MSAKLDTVASPAPQPAHPPHARAEDELDAAYKVCREIARCEAKNFYYAFLALPKPKHNAICAVYAFMRHADDLADDESLPVAIRQERLQAWRTAWHAMAGAGSVSRQAAAHATEQIFLALNHARHRYGISLELLDQLVDGTTMDLTRPVHATDVGSEASFDTYETFDELYRYCYLVASVVGLVCIRIFEYTDRRAEQFAEELGIAFQVTNILRDVREDAQRRRVYLPLEDLAAHEVTLAEFERLASVGDSGPSPIGENLRRLLAFEAARAETFYASGRLLLPMIAPDSRPALWVLMTIYHRLLQRIASANYDVFSARIGVPSGQKYAILARGLLSMGRFRLFGGA